MNGKHSLCSKFLVLHLVDDFLSKQCHRLRRAMADAAVAHRAV